MSANLIIDYLFHCWFGYSKIVRYFLSNIVLISIILLYVTNTIQKKLTVKLLWTMDKMSIFVTRGAICFVLENKLSNILGNCICTNLEIPKDHALEAVEIGEKPHVG